MEGLSRTTSHRTNVSHTNDGHSEGNLNFTATRHGWSRTFSIPPTVIQHLDYATLESIIELNTLKLSSTHTRLFVEHPPNSDTWAKIRFWKDDGSLQSVLMQQFFIDRMQQGIVTNVDVRDRNERLAEDNLSVKSTINLPGSLSRPGQTREMLKQSRLGKLFSSSSPSVHHQLQESTQSQVTIPAPPPTTRLQAFKVILGLSSRAPPPPPKTEEQKEQEEEALHAAREEALRKARC